MNDINNETASMSAKEAFDDRLNRYFDFRDAKPEDFSPVAVENLARDLIQVCNNVGRYPDRVNSSSQRAMIATIVGEGSLLVKEWGRDGYKLNEAARLLTFTLNQKFGYTEAK